MNTIWPPIDPLDTEGSDSSMVDEYYEYQDEPKLEHEFRFLYGRWIRRTIAVDPEVIPRSDSSMVDEYNNRCSRPVMLW